MPFAHVGLPLKLGYLQLDLSDFIADVESLLFAVLDFQAVELKHGAGRNVIGVVYLLLYNCKDALRLCLVVLVNGPFKQKEIRF